MTTHYVRPGDHVFYEDGASGVHFEGIQPTTVVQPREYADKTEQLQVRPGDVVCVVAPGMTVFVKGVEPAKITVPEPPADRPLGNYMVTPETYAIIEDLVRIWQQPDFAWSSCVVDTHEAWPYLAEQLDKLVAQFA